VLEGARTVVLRPGVLRRDSTVEMSRVKLAKMLMLRWEPITSERITLLFGGGFVEGGLLSPSSAGSWMPGLFMIAFCWLLLGWAAEKGCLEGARRAALLVTTRVEARIVLKAFIVGGT
jgi:hypothetical protein